MDHFKLFVVCLLLMILFYQTEFIPLGALAVAGMIIDLAITIIEFVKSHQKDKKPTDKRAHGE